MAGATHRRGQEQPTEGVPPPPGSGGKTRFPEGGYPPDIRPPEESSGWIFRDVTDGTGSRLSLHWLEVPSQLCVSPAAMEARETMQT